MNICEWSRIRSEKNVKTQETIISSPHSQNPVNAPKLRIGARVRLYARSFRAKRHQSAYHSKALVALFLKTSNERGVVAEVSAQNAAKAPKPCKTPDSRPLAPTRRRIPRQNINLRNRQTHLIELFPTMPNNAGITAEIFAQNAAGPVPRSKSSKTLSLLAATARRYHNPSRRNLYCPIEQIEGYNYHKSHTTKSIPTPATALLNAQNPRFRPSNRLITTLSLTNHHQISSIVSAVSDNPL